MLTHNKVCRRLVLLSLLLGICGHQSSSPQSIPGEGRFPIPPPAGRGEALHPEDILTNISSEGSYFDPSARDVPRKASKHEGSIRIRKNPSSQLFHLPRLLAWCLPADKPNCISEHTQESMLVCPEDAKGHYTSPRALPSTPEYINTFLL